MTGDLVETLEELHASGRLEMVELPLEDLQEDPENARMHGSRNLAAIRSSLKEYGQVEPLVVQSETYRVIGGNGRLRAMRELGFVKAKVVIIDVDDVRARALGVALNRTAELAEWDQQALGSILSELEMDGFDTEQIGFSDEDVRTILSQANTVDITNFAKPEKELEEEADAGPKGDQRPVGDGNWFYVEYYGDPDTFERLRAILAPYMTSTSRTAHQLERNAFVEMVSLFAKAKSEEMGNAEQE